MSVEDDTNPVLFDIRPKSYKIMGSTYVVPIQNKHEWRLDDLKGPLAEKGVYLVSKEDMDLLKACDKMRLWSADDKSAVEKVFKLEHVRRMAKQARELKKEKRVLVRPSMRDPVTQELREGLPGYELGTITWDEHVEAFAVHRAKNPAFGLSAKKIADRGGFEYLELVTYLGREPSTWKARDNPSKFKEP